MSDTLINITEQLRKPLDNESIGCGVLVDLQKSFDTVDHQILLAKLNQFSLYMNDLNQVIKFYIFHQFVDDNNLLCLGNSIKKLSKLVNVDIKHQLNW